MRRVIFAVFILVLILGCDNTRVFEKNTEIPKKTWSANNKLGFEVTITDTLKTYNFFLNFRHTEAYPYSNFYFFFNSYLPNGKLRKDTIHCKLADPTGKWYGSQAGDIIDNQILFKYNHSLPVAGNYFFEVEQAMREENLAEVLDVGLRVEYYKQ